MDLRKIAVIGCGMVGSSTAFALMQSGLFTDILLIDRDNDRAVGEAMDLSHCQPFTHAADIRAGSYDMLADYGIIVITAGVGQKPGETRQDLIHNNIKVLRSIIPEIIKYNLDAILLVVTNPVDVLTHAALKLSGFHKNRVLGSGTVLDSARLKFAVGKRLNVDPNNVHAFVIGEHGDSELAVWSSANISGIPLDAYCAHCGYKSHEENRKKLAFEVRNSAYEIIKRKGATYYGIAAATTAICESIVRDAHTIMPVSTLVNNMYGLNDVCISVPALIGSGGVEDIAEIALSDVERDALRISAETLKAAVKNADI